MPLPQPPQNYQNEEEGNAIATVGLILAFLVPLAGIICSIIGLNKAKKLNGKGHGLALAGLIISIPMFIISIGFFLALVFLAVPAFQRNARNSSRQTDVQLIQAAISHYSSNNSGNPLTNKATLDESLKDVDLVHYFGTADGLEDTLGADIYIVERTDLIPSDTDRLPDVDTLHILIGAKCKAGVLPESSTSASSVNYTVGGANVVEEERSLIFAIIYAQENEAKINCEDNAN